MGLSCLSEFSAWPHTKASCKQYLCSYRYVGWQTLLLLFWANIWKTQLERNNTGTCAYQLPFAFLASVCWVSTTWQCVVCFMENWKEQNSMRIHHSIRAKVPVRDWHSVSFDPALHFQSGASSQNNPTHGHILWIATCEYGNYVMILWVEVGWSLTGAFPVVLSASILIQRNYIHISHSHLWSEWRLG